MIFCMNGYCLQYTLNALALSLSNNSKYFAIIFFYYHLHNSS